MYSPMRITAPDANMVSMNYMIFPAYAGLAMM